MRAKNAPGSRRRRCPASRARPADCENHLQRRTGQRERAAGQEPQQDARQANLEENHAVRRPVADGKRRDFPHAQFFGADPGKKKKKKEKTANATV
jgi:hypothetical protein